MSKKKKPKKTKKRNKTPVIKTENDAIAFAKKYIKANKIPTNKHFEQLLTEYNQKLIEKGYGISKEKLLSLNVFDVRQIVEKGENNSPIYIAPVKLTEEIKTWYKTHGWLSLIPCFSEGVMHLNDDRYLYYRVENLNTDTKTYTITLNDYIQQKTYWDVGCQETYTIKMTNDETLYEMEELIDEEHPQRMYPQLYTLIPAYEMGWNTQLQKEWQIIINYTIAARKGMTAGIVNFQSYMCTQFLHIIMIINFYLSKNKASRPIKEKEETNTRHTEKKKADVINTERPKRRVGIIIVKSDKPPKIITKDSVIKYKTVSWHRRATTRTLKSGRTVFVKESVCYRKCLRDKKHETPNVTIEFKK